MLLLTLVAVVGLVASVVDTVRLHRSDPGVRQWAVRRTAHYPARAHAYSYPLVDGVAYLAGAESSSTFLPISYGQECGRSGCTTVTNGILANGFGVTWPDQVPLGQAFDVREPVWDWGFGSRLIDGDGTAIGYIVAGVLLDGFSVLVLVHLVKLASRWLRHRQQGRQQGRQTAGSDWLPSR